MARAAFLFVAVFRFLFLVLDHTGVLKFIEKMGGDVQLHPVDDVMAGPPRGLPFEAGAGTVVEPRNRRAFWKRWRPPRCPPW